MASIQDSAKSMRQRVHVLCTLESIDPSARQLKIVLADGRQVRCVTATAMDLKALEPFRGKRVVVGGIGVWDLSSRLERIDVDRVLPGEGESDFWAWLPIPHIVFDLPPEAPTPEPWEPESIIGRWPGDESDEEIEQALKEIS